MHIMQSRRDFLTTLSAAGAAGVLGARRSLADEGPPETTTIRLARDPAICVAPCYIADDLLRAEGFTDIRYVPRSRTATPSHAARSTSTWRPHAWIVSQLDAGEPITALAGVHSGCYELFAHEPIRTISDLKGKKGRHPGRSARAGTCCRDDGGPRRARPSEGHRLGHPVRAEPP